MGKSSGGSPSIMMIPQQQQSSSTVSLPAWVDQAAQENLRMANDISGRLPGPYTGQRVADMTQGQLSAIDAINKNVGSTAGQFNAASGIAAGALQGTAPVFNNAMSLAGSSINPASVQSAMSGIQSSINQAYSPLTTSGNYANIDYSGQGYTPINFNNQSYQGLDVNRTPYSSVQAGANPVDESLGLIRGNTGATGNTIAGALDSIGSSFNPVYQNTNPALNSLKGTVADAKDMQQFQADRVASQSLPQGDISQYMSPYTQNVIDSSLRTLDKQRLNSLNANADGAIGANAGFGSRAALQDAVTNAEFGDRAASLNANLQGQNFQQAQSALQADQARRLQADLANQSAGIQGAGVRQNAAQLAMQSANTLGNLGLSTGQFGVNTANTLGNLGLNNAQFQLGAANTMGNLGLQNRAQDIGVQQTNAGLALQNQAQINNAQQNNAALALQNQGLGINAGQANMSAGLQQRGQNLDAQQSNQNAALQGMQLEQQRQLSNANLGLQQQQQNQNAYNALGSLGLNNAQLTQSGAGLLGNLGNQFANLGLDTSRTLGDLSGAGQQAFLQGANAGIDAGGLLQNQQQNQITAAQQAIADQRSAMLDPITLRLQALGQTPYGQTTTGSSFGLQGQAYQPTSSSPFAGLLGAGLSGLSAASGLGWRPLGR
jgi:hypothetical protein